VKNREIEVKLMRKSLETAEITAKIDKSCGNLILTLLVKTLSVLKNKSPFRIAPNHPLKSPQTRIKNTPIQKNKIDILLIKIEKKNMFATHAKKRKSYGLGSAPAIFPDISAEMPAENEQNEQWRANQAPENGSVGGRIHRIKRIFGAFCCILHRFWVDFDCFFF
jgi:hypothetical protein